MKENENLKSAKDLQNPDGGQPETLEINVADDVDLDETIK